MYPRPRHKAVERFFDLLGSDTDTRKSWIAAFRAKRLSRAAKIAVVAAETFLLFVQGQGYAAMGTTQYITTSSALQEIRESSPVEEDQALPQGFIILSQKHGQPIRDQSILT